MNNFQNSKAINLLNYHKVNTIKFNLLTIKNDPEYKDFDLFYDKIYAQSPYQRSVEKFKITDFCLYLSEYNSHAFINLVNQKCIFRKKREGEIIENLF